MRSIRAGLPALLEPAGLRVTAIAAAIGAFAGLAWGLADEPAYEATATVIVVDRGESAQSLGEGATAADGERVLELARGRDAAEQAAADLGGDVAGADLLAVTEFNLDDSGAVVSVRSVAASPDIAAAAANAYAGALVELTSVLERRRLNRSVDQLEERQGDIEPGSKRAEAVESRLSATEELLAAGPPLRSGAEGTLPEEPVSSRPTVALAFAGAALGALLAALSLLAGRAGRRPIRAAGAFEAAIGAPVIAILGPGAGAAPTPEPGIVEIDAEEGPALASLSDRLGLGRDQGGPGSLAIVSASAGEGRTSLALGLAAVATIRGANVIVIETDLRSPDLGSRLGIPTAPGLTDYLAGEAVPREVIRSVPIGVDEPPEEVPSFVAVTAGSDLTSPNTTLAGSRFEGLIAQLSRVYDLVIFDTPPLLGSGDGMLVAAMAEATIICARAGVSDPEEIAAARAGVEDADLRGGVLLGLDPASGAGETAGGPGSARSAE